MMAHEVTILLVSLPYYLAMQASANACARQITLLSPLRHR